MQKDKLQKGKNELRDIKLSREEKAVLFANIITSTSAIAEKTHSETHSRLSPFGVYTFGAWISAKPVRMILSILVLIFVAGGGLVSAAEGSLPGDTLFPVKINITEPIRNALATGPVAQAKWQTEKTARRLDEATALANNGNLTAPASNEIKSMITDNTKAFDNALAEIQNSDSSGASSTVEELSGKFRQTLSSHAIVLEKINRGDEGDGSDGEGHAVSAVSAASAVSPASVSSPASSTSPASAAKVRATSATQAVTPTPTPTSSVMPASNIRSGGDDRRDNEDRGFEDNEPE